MSVPPTPSPTENRAEAGVAPLSRLARLRERVADGGREAGMTTAEYAVGTVAACGFGGVLYKVITDDSVVSLLGKLFAKALKVSF